MKPVPTVIFIILAIFSACAASPADAEDQIAAIVNKDVITSKDISDFLNFTRVQLSRNYKGRQLEEKLQTMKLDLLGRLIDDRLILQEAKKENITIDENRIKGRMDEVRREYRSESEFQDDLHKQGMVPADIEQKIREQMLIFTVIDQKVKSKILVRPEEVTRYYNENPMEFMIPQTRETEAYALENEDLAKTFSYNLGSGQKVDDLATRYPFTVNKLTVYEGAGMKPEIEKAVLKLGLNEISPPVEVDDKFYVFRVINITTPRQEPLSEAKDDISNLLYNKKMEEGFSAWMDELKKKAYIKVMEKEN